MKQAITFVYGCAYLIISEALASSPVVLPRHQLVTVGTKFTVECQLPEPTAISFTMYTWITSNQKILATTSEPIFNYTQDSVNTIDIKCDAENNEGDVRQGVNFSTVKVEGK